ncbi:MAG: hypothetical protein B6229_04695 [Spirochaetaceae bacterium 4572_7]|nr:MAG: hypothetical protein B6229_04695 [Spirochaetaceae bacterium 4572_7]
MTKNMTCIACPRGCLLTVTEENSNVTVKGNQCKKGISYGKQEILQPLRMLTTTVKTTHTVYPRVSVCLSKDIPLEDISKYLEVVNNITINENCIPGDILYKNILNKGVDLIATGEIKYDKK